MVPIVDIRTVCYFFYPRRNRYYLRKARQTQHGLMDFDPSQGDVIFNQYRMGGVASEYKVLEK